MKQTNMEQIQKLAIAMLYIEPKPIMNGLFLRHPFFESAYFIGPDKNSINILEDEEGKNYVFEQYIERIKRSNTYTGLAGFISKPYRLTFYEHTKCYASKEDAGECLRYVWQSSEGVNAGDAIHLSAIRKWFKELPKENLMESDELEVYNGLPEEVIIYRGVGDKKQKIKALSWTLSKEVAEFFAN